MRRIAEGTAPAATVLAAALAWWVTVDRMAGMDAGPGAQLGAFGWFVITWLLMVAAMMLPAAAPALRTASDHRPRRAVGTIATVAAYLAVWTVAGALAYLGLRTGRSLFGGVLQWQQTGHWVCATVIVAAAGYQLTAAKTRALMRCRAPSDDSTLSGGLWAGARAGLRCVASSWALMAVLFSLGAMSVTWTAIVAGLIALERLMPSRWWYRPGHTLSIRVASAAGLIGLAIAVAVSPGALPGFTVPGSPPARRAMMRMGEMPTSGSMMARPEMHQQDAR